jgi:hypothetical protein
MIGDFRLIPDFPRKWIEFPDGVVDISMAQLGKMHLWEVVGDEDAGDWMFESDEAVEMKEKKTEG